MKKFLAAVILFTLAIINPLESEARSRSGYSSHSSSHSTYVHGYTKRNGTHVSGYHRTTANGTKLDNYSTKGNVNPYTGKVGTKSPY